VINCLINCNNAATCLCPYVSANLLLIIHSDQKVSVHLMITIQKVDK